jgi:PAS domain-containing protein
MVPPFRHESRTRYFCVLSFDITDKRKAEFILILSEERNRRYLNNAPDGIFIADDGGKYNQTNRPRRQCLGITGAELGRMTIVDVAPPELAEAAKRGFSN